MVAETKSDRRSLGPVDYVLQFLLAVSWLAAFGAFVIAAAGLLSLAALGQLGLLRGVTTSDCIFLLVLAIIAAAAAVAAWRIRDVFFGWAELSDPAPPYSR